MVQVKLSNAQQKVLEEAKRDIDKARSMNFYDWYRSCNPYFENASEEKIDESLARDDRHNFWRKLYEHGKNGIAHTHCNGKTIYKLEALGLIEIVRDGTNQAYDYDYVKVLGY